MSGSCGLYHFKRKKRIIGEKQKDRAHKPLKLFFFEGESFSPHLNVAWTRLSFRDACRTEGIAAWPPTVGTAGITQESGQRGAVYEGENENKVKKKQVHEVRWGELQMRLSGGGTETCRSATPRTLTLMATIYSGQHLKMPLSETACCKDKGCKDGNVNPAEQLPTPPRCWCLLHSMANASAPTGTLTLRWETLIVSPAVSAHSHLLPTVCFLHL